MTDTPHRSAGVILAAALLLVAAPLGAQEGPPEGTQFVFINSETLLQQAPGAEEAQEAWTRELTEMQTEFQEMSMELQQMQEAYQQQEAMLSEEARERRQQEIMEKQQELMEKREELEQRAAQRQQELLAPILDEVQAVIDQIIEERGYVMVFDAAAAGLLAADPRLDITDMVLDRLREGGGVTGSTGPGR